MENNTIENNFDYLIIGGGLAGFLFAHHLQKNNKSFLIFDPLKTNTSSKVAAGMFNPISGKRMTVNWKIDELLAELKNTFTEIEALLKIKLLRFEPTHQVFGNNKEANDFWSRMENGAFKEFISETETCEPYLNAPNSCFEVIQSGWVETRNYIDAYGQYLVGKNLLRKEQLIYAGLVQTENVWQYENNIFGKVVCCEGYQALQNPYFNWLPFKLSKGQILLIHCPGLNTEKILKKGVYLVHQGNHYYKVGATYEWDDLDEIANEKGKNFLLEKLKNMLTIPFEVVDQYAGVRPTTRDRKAILGAHPHLGNLFVFNGLGTKGVLQAPFLAKHLYEHIENGLVLESEVDILRFPQFYSNSQR